MCIRDSLYGFNGRNSDQRFGTTTTRLIEPVAHTLSLIHIYRYRLALQGRICHEQRIELTDECVTATHEFHQTIYIMRHEPRDVYKRQSSVAVPYGTE